jgi:hypothetical protein
MARRPATRSARLERERELRQHVLGAIEAGSPQESSALEAELELERVQSLDEAQSHDGALGDLAQGLYLERQGQVVDLLQAEDLLPVGGDPAVLDRFVPEGHSRVAARRDLAGSESQPGRSGAVHGPGAVGRQLQGQHVARVVTPPVEELDPGTLLGRSTQAASVDQQVAVDDPQRLSREAGDALDHRVALRVAENDGRETL